MNRHLLLSTALGCFLVFFLPGVRGDHPAEHPKEHPEHPAPSPAKKEVATADISEGIKKHIEEQTKKGGGKFRIKDGEKELILTLVKIHDGKPARSEDGSYFACVDFKGEDGNACDVDFFLTGEPGAMKVEKTAVHKVNGKPRYEWKQKADGRYVEVPAPAPSTGK